MLFGFKWGEHEDVFSIILDCRDKTGRMSYAPDIVMMCRPDISERSLTETLRH